MFNGLKTLALLLAAVMFAIGSVGVASAQVTPAVPNAAGGAGAGVVVDSVVVQGNERVEASAVQVVSTLEAGQRVNEFTIQEAIRRLMRTGNYDSVQIAFEGESPEGVTLIINVVERPYITAFEIQGLERVRASEVRDTVGLTDDRPLNPQLIVDTERTIRDMLAAEGVQLASLDTSLVAVPDEPNSYRLVFEVEEGNRLAIADIDFQGNEAFDDDALRGALDTKEEGFLWFRPGKYDPTTFQQDLLQGLPEFYGSHGYVDFRVVSDTLLIDPRSGKARLRIDVNEGPQYRLGEFEVEGATRFPVDQLERMFTTQARSVLGLPFGSDDQTAGEIFDRAALDAATERVRQLYRNSGYLYASVEPVVQRVENEDGQPVVNVTWAVNEGSPFYINRITIEGNTYTHDSVIRDRLVVYPGDIYSEDRLIQSYRSIAALGFFETPLPNPDIRPNPDEATVDLVFTVKEKSTGSINFGTAIGGGGYGRAGGVSGFIGFTQPNLFGQAKQASVQAEYGYGRSSLTASYTDPALFGTRNSGSISVFHTDDRYRQGGFSFSEGRQTRTGASLRYGFPLFNFRWARAFAGYSLSQYSYQARDADDCVSGSIFCQPNALSSTFSVGLTRDTKDHPLFPTIGTSQNLTIQQTGGILGGDGNYRKVTGSADWWIPVGQFGGGQPGSRPIIITFGLQAHAGAVFGDASRFPLEHFFLGGTQFGEVLRGYGEAEVTPLGFFSRDDRSVPDGRRLGDAFFTISGEYALRLMDNLSVSAFAEAGNIWNDPASFNASTLFRSVGVGALVVTPFGPLGLDYAYGFDKTEPGWKFHFKINQPGF